MSAAPQSILAFRNGSIGNTLAAVPALRALRKRYPDTALSVVVDPVGQELLAHCPWITRLIVYDKHGRDRGLGGWLRVVRELRAVAPTHAVLFKRFFRNGLLARASGAPVRAGFATAGRAPFLNRTLPYDESLPIVDLNLRLAALLDAPPAGRELEIFHSDSDRQFAREILTQHSLEPRRFLVAHYGGQTTAPDFLPVARFVELLRAFNVQGEPMLLIGHGRAEAASADAIAQQYPPAIPRTGLPLRTTAALLEKARLFLGFNSGPAHIAAAVNLPEFILYRPDAHAPAEIRKWCPPTELAHPLLPPPLDDDAAWSRFLGNVHALAATFSPQPTSPSRGT